MNIPTRNPYSFTYMKKKLLEYFGKSIVIAEIIGKQNVVTFGSTVSEIIHNFYTQPKEDDPRDKSSESLKLLLNFFALT